MSRLDPEALQRARRLYEETGTPLHEIGAEVGRSAATIHYLAKRQGWVRFAGARRSHRQLPRVPGRAEMIARLYRAFERQVAEIEARFGDGGAAVGDEDARTLGSLARTLEKLIELDREQTEDRQNQEPVDLDRLRKKLADHLRRLGGGGS